MQFRHRLKVTLAVLACVLLTTIHPGKVLAAIADVNIGIVDAGPAAVLTAQWGATAAYLGQQIPGRRFNIIALKYEDIAVAVAERRIDFLITDPANYVVMQQAYGISASLTMQRQITPYFASSQYAAVIFVRGDQDQIQTMADLQGKSMVAVHEKDLGGWIMAWHQFNLLGIDPYQALRQLDFVHSDQSVVRAVLSGVVDAGTVRTGVIEEMVRTGQLRSDELRVLMPQTYIGADGRRPQLLHSTPFLPEWPLARLQHVSNELATAVSIALLSIPAKHAVLNDAGLAAWLPPEQYNAVHELMQDLKLAGYRHYGEITTNQLLRQYGYVIASALALVLFGLLVIWRMKRWLARLQGILAASQLSNEEQQQRIAQLQQREEHVNAVIENIVSGYLCVDKQWHVVEHNSEALTMLTGSRPLLKGKMLWAVLGDLNRSDFAQSFASGKPAEFTLYFAPTDRWLEFYTYPSAMAMEVYFRDISKQVRTEAALHEKENRLQAILSHMLDAVIAIDDKGIIQQFNHAAETMFGYHASEILGENISMLMPSSFAGQHQDHIRRYLQTRQSTTVGVGRELTGKRRNGTTFTLDITISDIEINNRHIFIGICRDVSERKQQQLVLQRLATAVDHTADGVFITDSDGIVEYVNNAYENITGCSARDSRGRYHLLFENNAELLGDSCHQVLSGREHWHGRYQRKRSNKEDYIEESTLTPVLDQRQRVQYFVGVCRDASGEQWRQENIQFKQRSAMVNAFNGEIAREAGRILHSVLEHTEFAQTSTDPRSPAARHLNQAASAVNRAEVLINRLVTFGCGDSFQVEYFQPLQYISDMVLSLRVVYAPRVDIVFRHDGDMPSIEMSPVYFQQLLMGMMLSAVRACDGGHGTVTIEIGRACMAPAARLPSVAKGDSLVLTVKDSGGPLVGLGVGQVAGSIQSHALTQAGRPCLAAVQSIVTDAGGAIVLDNTADGLSVSVYLPVAPGAIED